MGREGVRMLSQGEPLTIPERCRGIIKRHQELKQAGKKLSNFSLIPRNLFKLTS